MFSLLLRLDIKFISAADLKHDYSSFTSKIPTGILSTRMAN